LALGRKKETGEWRKLHNVELHECNWSVGQVTGVLMGVPGRPGRRWKDDIKMDLSP